MTLSSSLLIKHTVDRPGHRPYARLVALPPMPVDRRQGLVATQPTDGVFHLDPPAREGPVEAPIFWRSFLAARLAAGRRPWQLRVDPVQTDVAEIPQRPDLRP